MDKTVEKIIKIIDEKIDYWRNYETKCEHERIEYGRYTTLLAEIKFNIKKEFQNDANNL